VAGPAGVIEAEGAPTETEVWAATCVPAAARTSDKAPDVRIFGIVDVTLFLVAITSPQLSESER
jgi:hypothetical protein